jgi:DNA mismatch repair protein MutL
MTTAEYKAQAALHKGEPQPKPQPKPAPEAKPAPKEEPMILLRDTTPLPYGEKKEPSARLRHLEDWEEPEEVLPPPEPPVENYVENTENPAETAPSLPEETVSPQQRVELPQSPAPVADAPIEEETEERPWRIVGELFHTYILVEQGDTVLLIDKHAAHERMNFDRLKAQGYRPMAQQLLTPQVFTPEAEEGAAILQNTSLLLELGFECEDFGDGAILVRQVPYDIDPEETESTLTELAAKLMTAGTLDPDGARDDLLHTIACKAAIKGGQKNGPEELRVVAEAVMRDQVRYCPHGRPVAIELTRKQLEKQFKRA